MDPPRIAIVAALARNRVIGRGNRLPWHLPDDLRRFKRLTLGRAIIMGRRTWESLPGLLPDRTHVVVTRDPGYRADGAVVAHSLDAARAAAGEPCRKAVASHGRSPPGDCAVGGLGRGKRPWRAAGA